MATTRTIQVLGSAKAYDGATGTGNITATLNGVTVFSGTIPATPEMLFSFEVDMATSGSIPMTVTIENCNVYMGGILANYCVGNEIVPPPAPPAPQYESTGPDGFYSTSLSGDSRANVTCTGAAYCSPPPPNPRPAEAQGTWGWQVNTNPGTPAVFGYDLQIDAGIA